MLDQLVESKSNVQNTKRRGSYLLTTSVLVFSMFASGIMWSLFAKNLDIGSDSLELSSMVAPVQITEEPPPVEQIREVKQDNSQKVEDTLPVRNENIARMDETQPIPKEISVTPSTQRARPNGDFRIDPDAKETNGTTTNRTGNSENNSTGISKIVKPNETDKSDTEEPPPTIIKKVEPAKVEKPVNNKPVSKGVINGIAISLPKPIYPPPARAIGASGDVNVQVTIDERGNVISATAVSGHPLLRQVSEGAARGAKFKPTLLSEVPVKVTGVIVYKFAKP